jgi:hypothetical protein
MSNNYSLVRGRRMRVTALDGCGNPVYAAESTAVTDGFISVAFSAQTTEAEVIEVTRADGQVCVRDTGVPAFNGYSLEISFCNVLPCVYNMLTGQPVVNDTSGSPVGFKMNSDVDVSAQAFALELWAGVPSAACSGGAGAYGYILVPFIQSGVIGDFSIENAAVNFSITGAATKDGNAWGTGPYDVLDDGLGAAGPLPDALDVNDHLYVAWTDIAPPAVTDGCVTLTAG